MIYSLIDEAKPTSITISWSLSRAGNFLVVEFFDETNSTISSISRLLVTPENSSAQFLVNTSSNTRYRVTGEINNQKNSFASVLLTRDSTSYTNTSFPQIVLNGIINERKKISPV
ncbi:MAG: hypothetical protein ACQUHE_18350 [Bacteroidia bacterium]